MGVTLPTRMSPWLHGGADADDAALVQVLEHLLADLGDVAGDLFGAQLGVAGVDLELLDVDGGVEVFLHHALGDEDGVLEVVAAPGHVGHDEVAAQGQFAVLGAGTVGQDLAGGDVLALLHEGHLVEAGVLVGAGVLDQGVDVHAALHRPRSRDRPRRAPRCGWRPRSRRCRERRQSTQAPESLAA